MSEQAPIIDNMRGKLYDRPSLQSALESDAFSIMRPNFDQEASLEPHELTVDLVEAVIDRIISSGILDDHDTRPIFRGDNIVVGVS